MKGMLIALFLTVYSSLTFAMGDSEFEEVIQQIRSGEYAKVKSYLENHQEQYRNDPDYYVILLNYTRVVADQSHQVIARGEARDGDLEIRDSKTGKPVGFMGRRGGYDSSMIRDAIEQTEEALPNFKSRLDVHIGMAYLAEEIKDWKMLSRLLMTTLDMSEEIDNKWTWGSLNHMKGAPKEFMLNNIETRVRAMFYEDSDKADQALVRVSKKLINTYPKSIYGYANLGSYFLIKKQYGKAESYYKKALEIDPNDEVVKANYKKLEQMRDAQ